MITHPENNLDKQNEQCPFHQSDNAYSHQKTAVQARMRPLPYEQTPDGEWHIYDYDIAKSILRSSDTRQAGFKAELFHDTPDSFNMKEPILFQDGPDHHAQRRETARFFTPKKTDTSYRAMMTEFADQIMADFLAKGEADLSELTMRLAVRVAAQVVGLTDSRLPGMSNRLNKFFESDVTTEIGWSPAKLVELVQSQVRVAKFLYLDVKPAIRMREKERQDDVISHLIDHGRSDADILTECLVYGAAGMVTTREFILVAAWHFLDNPDLRGIYLKSDQAERYQLLEEILRIEPVVGVILRRASAPIAVEWQDQAVTIPSGTLINLHIHAINADESVVGQDALAVCPGRPLEKRALSPMFSFGDGHHRCPGAYIAIQESDIFLMKLLALDNLQLVSTPTITYRDLIKSYEIRDFIIKAV